MAFKPNGTLMGMCIYLSSYLTRKRYLFGISLHLAVKSELKENTDVDKTKPNFDI